MPGHFLKCFPSSSTSSGIADCVVVSVSILYVYVGLLFSILVVYFLPPGPLLIEVLVMVEPGELGRFDLAILSEWGCLQGWKLSHIKHYPDHPKLKICKLFGANNWKLYRSKKNSSDLMNSVRCEIETKGDRCEFSIQVDEKHAQRQRDLAFLGNMGGTC